MRSSIDCALGLYNLVEEQVHTLVTRSNGRLEHLQFLRKIRELEAEFCQVSESWGAPWGIAEWSGIASLALTAFYFNMKPM
uniref:Uncharacterized protein n=1 Tax=Sphaerodactylus townsendi TaxID=933632 RepID=A0ACB8F7B0_9SAUR